MAREDLRDPAADRLALRRSFVLVLLVAGLAVGAATVVAFQNRPADHHYVFYATYGNANQVPYTLLLSLPADADVREQFIFLGNGTAVAEPSAYGVVLRISSWSNISVSARLDTWRDLGAGFSTEGAGADGRVGARVFLNSTEFSVASVVKISFTKVDPTWTLTRTADADLFEGWNTIAVKETLSRTTAR